MLRHSLFAALLAGGLMGYGCSTDDISITLTPTPDEKTTVIDVVLADPNLSTLVAAVQKAGLVEALSDASGSFTFFAPTNAAFEAAGIDVAATDVETLTAVLTYHVVAGIAKSGDIGTGTWGTLNGAFLIAETDGGTVTLDDSATVTEADREADNGVVHIIDSVLLPPTETILGLLKADADFSELVAALETTGLDTALDGEDALTIFAPTNDALAAAATITAGLSTEELAEVLKYHVVSGKVFSFDLTTGDFPTLNTAATIAIDVDALTVNDVGIVAEGVNIQGTNGVIHTIGGVLVP